LKQHGYGRAERRRLQQGQPCHQRLTGIDLVWHILIQERAAEKIRSSADKDFDTMLHCSGTIIRPAAF
jgi:hypothetical protein